MNYLYIMSFRQYLYAVLCVFITISVNAQQKPYVAPMLKNYMVQQENSGKLNQPVDLILDGDVAEIERLVKTNGGHVKYSKGNLVSVRVPLSTVEALSQSKHVKPIEFTIEKGVSLNDTMRMRNHVNEVHNALSPLQQAYTGENIVLGFIDTGIDYTHPDFQNPDGTTRVLEIWDQTKPFDATYTPVKYGYGQVWDSAQINNGQSTHDILGTHHGSTVAGAACGNGLASGDNMGVAPNAQIVMVESDFSRSNWFATVADAVDYIFSVADKHGLPCVINASVGGYLGSHDALDAPALMIDELLNEKSGRLLVAAAGNSGAKPPYHVRRERKLLDLDTTFTWFQVNNSSAFGIPAAYIDVWADSADFVNIKFAIGADKVSPNYQFRGRTGFKNIVDDNMVNITVYDQIVVDTKKICDIQYYVTKKQSRYRLEVLIPNPDSAQYNFRFMTTGLGQYDMWSAEFLGISNLVSSGLPTKSDFADIKNYILPDTLQSIVTSWACSPNVITVANYSNANSWVDYDGNTQTNANVPKALHPSSSRGPSRLGVMKPDLGASGALTFSPSVVSGIMNLRTSNPSRVHQSGWHLSNGGTSMSSPVVAGIGALLLERCPKLTPQKFKEIITSTTFTDEFTGIDLPNYEWGHGKVSAYNALISTLYTPFIADTIICDGESVTLSPSEVYSTYQWHDGSNASSITLNANTNGYLITENEFGCISDTAFFNVTVDADPNCALWLDQAYKIDAKVYPNPVQNQLYIELPKTDDYQLTLFDVTGRTVYQTDINDVQHTIDLRNISSGAYILFIKNKQAQSLKISVVKN